MITSNFIHRTFRIRYKTAIGTAFTVDVDGRQYLVTAQHIVPSINQQASIDVFSNNEWVSIPVQLVGHGSDTIDLSVFAPGVMLTPPGLPIQASSDGMAYGQELYFLGFPYHFLGNIIFAEQGYPLPFVKRAILSCFSGDVYLLDGHNNPGFSGGPVVFGHPGASPTNVAAVISGYKFVPEPIYEGGVETELTYRYNTGIIVAYKIEHAVSLISANPIGLKLRDIEEMR